jgi:hypothetical protein
VQYIFHIIVNGYTLNSLVLKNSGREKELQHLKFGVKLKAVIVRHYVCFVTLLNVIIIIIIK